MIAIVHEAIHLQKNELVEPKITREIHHYHYYDYIQPLEVEIPNDSYATNAKGEVIHAPGGLGEHVGQSSQWQQDRQDRGYGGPHSLANEKDLEKTDSEAGRDRTEGPFPIEAEGGGERVLHEVQGGGIARRFGGNLTSPTSTTPRSNQPTGPEVSETTLRGGGFQTPKKENLHSTQEDSYAPIPPPDSASGPDLTATIERQFNRLSLQNQNQESESKPLPSLPDASPPSPTLSKGSVRRMSGDTKLRNRYSLDSSKGSWDGQNPNPVADDEDVPERGSNLGKTRID